MATIDKRISSTGKMSYRVRTRLNGFPAQIATFARKTDAQKWAAATESAQREGRYLTTSEAIEHALAVRQLMGGDAATEDAKILYDWIVREGQPRFTRTDCLRPYHGRFRQKKRLDAALDVLCQRRIVSRREREATGRPGRPAEVYEVNPLVADRK
jgi:hypothetical protein